MIDPNYVIEMQNKSRLSAPIVHALMSYSDDYINYAVFETEFLIYMMNTFNYKYFIFNIVAI